MSHTTPEPSPAELILRDGRPYHQIAAAADVSVETVGLAKRNNQWPKQRRPRLALRRALGLDQALPT